ncbi:RHS repeat domain-containing protein, partial [Bacteroides ovatus]|uniref:RHS repeat domain-containing protein n=2 Tax=Bacteroides ovatus TaxID=28116 RepID=UPI00202FE5BC
NGNMVKDLNKGISMIEYNSLNLPRRVTFTGVNNPVNEYVYSAGGKKLSVIHKSSTEKRTDYVGNLIYENGSLKRILVDGGYIENGTYHFYLQDHLGNNRVVARSDGTIVQTTHYYPYGMSFAEGTFADKQPYKYNGKELDTENGLNLYDYDARQMDIIFGRFTSVDPMAEKYYHWSPYAYCMDNPLKYIDPNGLDSYIILYSNSDSRFKAAAETRQREIMNSKSFTTEKDHVYMLNIGDLGNLGERIQNIVNDAKANGYGMTVEASFYTHGGTDGPVGDKVTSGDYNLRNVSGSSLDRNQLSAEGWKQINWNFDPKNSVAAFYGCHTVGFAERFFDISNVAFTAGQGGSSGPSYKTDDFDSVSPIFGILSKNIYYGSQEAGKFIGVTGYARNQYEKINNVKMRKEWEINGNVTIKNNSLIKSR